ncbi:MAG: hypothetical protein U5L45_07705 [Saprospiraceae bacterium]|nr:hypothetical protein [Saprospiraceae bacterium]
MVHFSGKARKMNHIPLFCERSERKRRNLSGRACFCRRKIVDFSPTKTRSPQGNTLGRFLSEAKKNLSRSSSGASN